MKDKPTRVIGDHIRGLAARSPRSVLVDTADGPRLVDPDAVLASGSPATRVLLTRADLHDAASAAGRSLSEFVTANAGAVAADVNALRATEGK